MRGHHDQIAMTGLSRSNDRFVRAGLDNVDRFTDNACGLRQARSSREEESERHGRAGAHAYSPEAASMRAWLVVLGWSEKR